MDPNALALSPAAGASLATPPHAGNSVRGARGRAGFRGVLPVASVRDMFSGLGDDKLFGGGEGENIYRSLLIQEYSKVAAKSGGVGIADAVQREILRAQEVK